MAADDTKYCNIIRTKKKPHQFLESFCGRTGKAVFRGHHFDRATECDKLPAYFYIYQAFREANPDCGLPDVEIVNYEYTPKVTIKKNIAIPDNYRKLIKIQKEFTEQFRGKGGCVELLNSMVSLFSYRNGYLDSHQFIAIPYSYAREKIYSDYRDLFDDESIINLYQYWLVKNEDTLMRLRLMEKKETFRFIYDHMNMEVYQKATRNKKC